MPLLTEQDKVAITELLVGHKVTKVTDDKLILDDGTKLTLTGNMGCAGCVSGQYDLSELNGVDNIITAVEFEDNPGDSDWDLDGSYRIFVYANNEKINLATFNGTDGNGYYGTGYRIDVEGAPRASS